MEILDRKFQHTYDNPQVRYDVNYRTEELAWAHESEANIKSYIARCKDDIAYYANTAAWTVNPRRKINRDRPMMLCLRQVELLQHIQNCVENDYDSAYLKSRYVGGSWGHMLFGAHQWMFVENFQALYGSRVDSLVESKGDGSIDALLPKFDHLIKNQPAILRAGLEAAGYNYADPWKVQMLRKNPATGAILTGEAMTENFGSGARGGLGFCDELSKAAAPEAAWVSLGQTVASRQAVATPKGKDFFWGLCFPDEYADLYGKSRDEVERPSIFRIYWKDIDWLNEFIVLDHGVRRGETWKTQRQFDQWYKELLKEPWKILQRGHGYLPHEELPLDMGYDDHGRITHEEKRYGATRLHGRAVSIIYPWYERERIRYDDQGAAQELDINFDNSKGGKVYSVQFKSATERPNIPRVDDYPLYIGLDPGRSAGNAFAINWGQWNFTKRKYQWLRMITAENRSAYYFLPLLTGLNEDYIQAEREHPTDDWYRLFDEMQKPIWRINGGAADPAGARQKNAASKHSVLEIFRMNSILLRADWKWHPFEARIGAARRVLAYSEFDMVMVPRLVTAIKETAWKEVKNGQSIPTGEGYFHHPIHSHPMAAYEYFSCYDPHQFETEQYAPDSPQERLVKAQAAAHGFRQLSDGNGYARHMEEMAAIADDESRSGY